jgi:chorismate mutase
MEEHDGMGSEPFVLVRLDTLPEAMQKTLEVKRMLSAGEVGNVQEAVKRVGLSRSSFYKYKDHVFPFNAMVKEKIITLSLTLADMAGVLSSVLVFLAQARANILTIHQTIPLQGEANVSMSIDTSQVEAFEEVLAGLRELSGVRRALVVGTGEKDEGMKV